MTKRQPAKFRKNTPADDADDARARTLYEQLTTQGQLRVCTETGTEFTIRYRKDSDGVRSYASDDGGKRLKYLLLSPGEVREWLRNLQVVEDAPDAQ